MLLEETADVPQQAPVRDLVAEANHRIANNLSAVAALVQHRAAAIEIDAAPLTAARVREMLHDVRTRVDAVARLHRALSSAPPNGQIDLGAYLQPIATGLIATLADPERVRLHFACELGCRVTPERALYLGQIVVELVTNSLKYAHPAGAPGQIDIICRRDPAGVMVEVSDDGVGFPEGFDPSHSDSSGLRLAHSLARQIEGTLTFDGSGLGLYAAVHAPAD